MGRLHYKCMSCDNTIIEGQYCHECDFTPQQLAEIAENMGFALVPLERSPKEALGFFKKVDKTVFKEWGHEPMELNEESAYRVLKVMIEVGRVKPQKPE